jgi:REP element-mobilizing transposase RayT
MPAPPDRPCAYYVTWATVDDRPWLAPDVEAPLLAALRAAAAAHDAALVEAMVHPAAVHLIAQAPATVAPAALVAALRAAAAARLRALPTTDPWPDPPWSADSYIATVGVPDTPALAAYFARHRPRSLN